MSDYKVSLDVYNGPLDLLLFLIRREEIDIHDIPIARVTQQYVEYVDLLQQLDPDAVSEFLVMAATLMEIKSRMLLPTPPVEEAEEEIVDPRRELVRQLLEYKKFKDAARYLDEASEMQVQKHPRSPGLPPRPADDVELDNLDIWDLFDAFNRLLEQTGRRGAVHQVDVDDTPLALHAEDVLDSLERSDGSQTFEAIFTGRSRAEMIGLFLALLELIRQHRIRVSQDRPFATIWIHLLDRKPLDHVSEEEPAAESDQRGVGETAVESVTQSVDESGQAVEDAADDVQKQPVSPVPPIGDDATRPMEINDDETQ